MATQKIPITFLNGFSSGRDVLGVIAFADMLSSEQTFCRFCYYFSGQWGRFAQDFDFDCKSLTLVGLPGESNRAWWLLGKNGEAVEIMGAVSNVDRIPGAGLGVQDSYGYVNTIKNIDEELYVCGYGRQVYRRRNGQWTSIAGDILTRETGRGFFDIDGADKQHIYAVGWHGEIYFYDGQEWHQDDSPTSVHLTSVRCVGAEEVWICGNHGTVLHGQFNQWDIIQDDDFQGHWYCIEEYDGATYLAGHASLAYVDGEAIVPVDTGLNKEITTHRLHAKEGLLWSIGEKDILVFDGTSWEEVLHPDNV